MQPILSLRLLELPCVTGMIVCDCVSFLFGYIPNLHNDIKLNQIPGEIKLGLLKEVLSIIEVQADASVKYAINLLPCQK